MALPLLVPGREPSEDGLEPDVPPVGGRRTCDQSGGGGGVGAGVGVSRLLTAARTAAAVAPREAQQELIDAAYAELERAKAAHRESLQLVGARWCYVLTGRCRCIAVWERHPDARSLCGLRISELASRQSPHEKRNTRA